MEPHYLAKEEAVEMNLNSWMQSNISDGAALPGSSRDDELLSHHSQRIVIFCTIAFIYLSFFLTIIYFIYIYYRHTLRSEPGGRRLPFII